MPSGGSRPGAGARRGNINGMRHGGRSRLMWDVWDALSDFVERWDEPALRAIVSRLDDAGLTGPGIEFDAGRAVRLLHPMLIDCLAAPGNHMKRPRGAIPRPKRASAEAGSPPRWALRPLATKIAPTNQTGAAIARRSAYNSPRASRAASRAASHAGGEPMTSDTTTTDIIEQDGLLAGPWRQPRNSSAEVSGSIHDDATARPLGFRGGTVAGSIHMEQLPPLLVRAFGQRWFETGGLSTYFRYATVDREPVRAFVRVPEPGADAQVDLWMEDEMGTQVLEGTASVGHPTSPSLLRAKVAAPRTPGELRMLAHLRTGATAGPVPTRLSRKRAEARQRLLTEPLPWYEGPSPWGGPIANPGLVVHIMRPIEAALGLVRGKAVGLFGAIEVQHLAGPVFIEHDYEVSATILKIGDTPKSEYVWYESVLREPGGGPDVASMIMMLRWMKASSPLWKET